jgi:predicted lipoprotein
MSALKNPSLLWLGAAAASLAFLLGSATIVRKDAPATAPTVTAPSVQQLWPRIAAHLDSKAVDAAVLLPALRADLEGAGAKYGYRSQGLESAWTFVVKLEGTVLAANADPVAPVLDIDIDDDGQADVQVLRGPLLLGTSLRDVLPFVSYGDFDNQIGFAEFAAALNDHAYAAAAPQLREAAPGRKLILLGTFSHDPRQALPLLMPVHLERGAP